eukprot:6182128-Pleurochrysis_carterae.AAC.4
MIAEDLQCARSNRQDPRFRRLFWKQLTVATAVLIFRRCASHQGSRFLPSCIRDHSPRAAFRPRLRVGGAPHAPGMCKLHMMDSESARERESFNM